VDILSETFPAKVKRVLDRVSYALILVFFSVVSWQTFVYGKRLLRTGELSETLKIAYYPFVFLVSFGFAVLALTILLDLVETFWTRGKGNERADRRVYGIVVMFSSCSCCASPPPSPWPWSGSWGSPR